jgi:hypothetical protein
MASLTYASDDARSQKSTNESDSEASRLGGYCAGERGLCLSSSHVDGGRRIRLEPQRIGLEPQRIGESSWHGRYGDSESRERFVAAEWLRGVYVYRFGLDQ